MHDVATPKRNRRERREAPTSDGVSTCGSGTSWLTLLGLRVKKKSALLAAIVGEGETHLESESGSLDESALDLGNGMLDLGESARISGCTE